MKVTVQDFKINTEISDDLFKFDPSTVSQIDDGDTHERITVPK